MTQPRIPKALAGAAVAFALLASASRAQEPNVPDPAPEAKPIEHQDPTLAAQEPPPAPTPVQNPPPIDLTGKPAGDPSSTPPQTPPSDPAANSAGSSPAKPAQEPPLVPPESKPAESPVAPGVKALDAAPAPALAKGTAVLPALGNVRDLASVQGAVDKIVAEHASLARPIPFGSTADGRKLPALLFGAEGSIALEDRPCVLLLGALDGESPTGGLAVLQMTAELLSEPATLPSGVSFAAVPWASPEGLELTLQGRSADGRNTRPVDEDRDGRIDEDGPDDLDGDGQILQMLVEDPEGPWIRPANQRLLAQARPGDAPRYSLALEGKDDDGDARFNEDGPGGVVLDLNFPVGRTGPWIDDLGGVLPLSETLSRNYADFALARRVAIVILLQGNHGRLAIPGGTKSALQAAWMPEADHSVFERVNAAFLGSTARRNLPPATLLECRGRERRGAALDWFYCVSGALSVEIAPWGPALDAAPETAPKEKQGAESRGGISAEDLAWARWLDDTRGGLGFVDWH
ncbi:MAG TPA: hypothetical protein VM509_06650, partial [Planctomycetota bacterium]|nr:hypothetical protein [Planctomycetota bacterium]